MYYYNLARTYAELNDTKQAIQNLKTAGEYKNNMIPGEQRPGPFNDPSFRYLLKNKKFIETAKAFR
jgi:hypothetical protein